MDGLIIVNKEAGMTSHDVVSKIRKIFQTKRVGHLGTLDPMATGVLVICLNEATKLVPYLENVKKEYICEITFGMSSDTYDSTGNIVNKTFDFNLDENKVDKTLNSFIGLSYQTPPIYSAIKINGKKLYEYARKNEDVVIPKREIFVYEIKRISKLTYEKDIAKCEFRTEVSKGTYIRSICNDIGIKLGIPALMSGLKRTKNGEFAIQNASTLDEIQKGNYKLISMLDALSSYEIIDNKNLIQKANNGMKISVCDIKNILGMLPQKIVIKDVDKLVAIYLYDIEHNCYKVGRVWK